MHIIINNSSMVPIYEQIVNAVKTMILSGELKQGDPLGSIRTLAAELKISALTVKKAYDQLENEGYTVTVHGKGSYVADGNTELIRESRRREIDRQMEEMVTQEKKYGFTPEEIRELMEIYLEE